MVAKCKATACRPMVIALLCAELTAITTQERCTATTDLTRTIAGWVATVSHHGGDCPATCKANCNYEAGEQSCDNGVDDNGCWMGNHCAMECPVVCPPMTHVTCSTDELVCGGGLDSNGCEMPEICMPMKSGTGDDGQDCWSTCPVTCDYDDGQIYCDGGFYNGCAAGGYCAYSYGDCPAMCYANCDYNAGEVWCDNGLDENGCSMGDYCSTTGCYATTATGATATGTTATGTTAPGTTGPAA